MTTNPSDPSGGQPEDPSKTWLSASSSSSQPPQSSSQSQSQSDQNAAQGQQPKKGPTLSDVEIKPTDFLTVHHRPCARQGFMTGIAGGVGMMGIRFIAGSPAMKAAHWGVGTFAGASILGWEYCRFQRRKEAEKMKRVVEVYDHRQAELALEKKKKMEEEQARKRLEEEEAAKRKGTSWKFW
ncbi:putative mitochondrial cytochrome c oxidase protein 20-like protein [Rhypophila decipiens]|uniref:Cytochrome c oxidase assembly protein COX20, mitochondrial n=1 Tax=Rhypophila decipiens TaxID=261697 RepID=A0AAN7BA04_9PEZI|nr:putative mitochondrial cytochrome c oxidase protein 20-like protein [Rhypophila decipiens]